MRTVVCFLLVLVGIIVLIQSGEAVVTTFPSSISVPRAISSARTVTYNLASPNGCRQAFSTGGQFITPGNIVIGSVNTYLSGFLAGQTFPTRGNISETFVIPPSVIKRAEQLGVRQILYRRQFQYVTVSCPIPPSPGGDPGTVQIAITTEAGAEFSINRLQLYFENRRAEITIKRNQPGVKAFVDIRYTGSGLLQGYWEVDGRILSYVNQHVVYGRQVTLESPDIPALPTIDTGTHIVRFIITNPTSTVTPPEAIYFVTAEEFVKRPIRLISPKNKSEEDFSPFVFKWEGRDQPITYLIEFLEVGAPTLREEGQKPIFSAYTKKAFYALPAPVLKSVFSPGKSYLWRVKGFDEDNKIVGESPEFQFTFKELASYVPRQILLVAEASQKGLELIGKIGGKFNLGLIETYDIKSLRTKVAVFQTREDIFRLISAILKEDGVVLAQPNYIFRTMAEPMSDRQNIYRVLNLKKLHEYFKGKGIMVAVIDTGVDIQHKDLKERIVSSENLLKERYTAEVHGTAVAGVIGASMNGFGIEGVAPEAGILALRACRQMSGENPEAECYTTSVAKAIDVAIEKKVKVVNMSFGSIFSDKLILKLIEEGTRRGIIFVAPVGNMPKQKEPTFPASHPLVVAVAGMDEKGNPYPNPEIASKARVSAPATNVLTTVPGDKHNFLNGTSLSSAAITGILTLATEKKGGIDIDRMPAFKGDLCKWEEELLKLPICEK
jgi:hypothetical protein